MLAELGTLADRGGRIGALFGLVLFGAAAPAPRRDRTAGVAPQYGGLPLAFVENRGQLSGDVDYYLLGSDASVEFGPRGPLVRLRADPGASPHAPGFASAAPWPAGSALTLRFVGGAEVRPEAEDPRVLRVGCFAGPEDRWRTGLRTCGRLRYRAVWPGIDVVYSAGAGVMKQEFVVEPGADPGRIGLEWTGALGLSLAADGALLVRSDAGTLRDEPPVSTQDLEDGRVDVPTRYVLAESGTTPLRCGFEVAAFDRTRPLVVDPAQIVQATYLGGPFGGIAQDVTVDARGAAYVTGQMGNPADGSLDAFVMKVAPDGGTVQTLTTLGGSQSDSGFGIALDGKGAVYVTGVASSPDFPTLRGPASRFGGGVSDAFVAKVGADGTLAYCGFIGGAKREYGADVAVDADGAAYVSGPTRSPPSSFPVTVGPALTFGGGYDLFVAKVAPDGSRLLYAGYVGGDNQDADAQADGQVAAGDVAVDAKGCAYVCGTTASTQATFPTGSGFGSIPSWNARYATHWDAFAAKVKADGTGLAWAGYVGGDDTDGALGVAVDDGGNAFVVGSTASGAKTFPTGAGFGDLSGPGRTYAGGTDAFAVKIGADGTKLLWAGYLGGRGFDKARAVALDRGGLVHVVGGTTSSDFAGTAGSFNAVAGGGIDAFLVRMKADGSALVDAGYLGGGGADQAAGVAVDAAGASYVVGLTNSPDTGFPTREGMAGRKGRFRTLEGGTTGFLVKVSR